MSIKTNNKYGKITISDGAIAMVANRVAVECYGVADLVSRRLTDTIAALFNARSSVRGVKIETLDNKINIELYVVLKDGVNIDAVVESLKSAVKYHVETITGMRVNEVIVNVVGIRV